MARTLFSITFLFTSLLSASAFAFAPQSQVVTLFDASNETEINGSDQTGSTVSTSLVTNSAYNTRSFPIANNQDSIPHDSGLISSDTLSQPDLAGTLYVLSGATGFNPNIVNANAAYHEFSLTIAEDQVGLDTLSFNYWATEDFFNDPEGTPTDYTYGVRGFAQVNDNTEDNDFTNFSFLQTTSGLDRIRIENNGVTLTSDRSNVVEFDLTSLGALSVGQNVDFRLSFFDFDTDSEVGSRTGPNNGSHIHRLDNVQVTAARLPTTASVPEPSAVCLLMGGFSLLGLRRRRSLGR